MSGNEKFMIKRIVLMALCLCACSENSGLSKETPRIAFKDGNELGEVVNVMSNNFACGYVGKYSTTTSTLSYRYKNYIEQGRYINNILKNSSRKGIAIKENQKLTSMLNKAEKMFAKSAIEDLEKSWLKEKESMSDFLTMCEGVEALTRRTLDKYLLN